MRLGGWHHGLEFLGNNSEASLTSGIIGQEFYGCSCTGEGALAQVTASTQFMALLFGPVAFDSVILHATSTFNVLQDHSFDRWGPLGVIVDLVIPTLFTAGFFGAHIAVTTSECNASFLETALD